MITMDRASITSDATRTGDQESQIMRMLEDLGKAGAALGMRKVNPDRDGTQRMIENGDEMKEEVNSFYISLFEKYGTANQFADERVDSSYQYPAGYNGAKPIEEQIAAIAEITGLDSASALEYAKNLPVLPEGAEGWFAVANPAALAKKYFPEVTDLAEQHCRAIKFALGKIKDSRSFYNYREDEITPEQLRRHARTVRMLEQITEAQQGSDILIIACQLGMRHRGKSVRRARETFMVNEFGLDSFLGACIALTHPGRFVRSDELDMDLPGDEFSGGDGVFDEAPCLLFRDDEVRFGAYEVGIASAHYGSASGFLPQ